MRQCSYARATSIDNALELGRPPATMYYAGGTTLTDLMKLDVLAPQTLVDINPLPLRSIELASDTLRLGALARMSDVADHPAVRDCVPAVAQALEQSASGQLRNMASLSGNVLQRTRCAYFRDIATPCNKREPGAGCSALSGLNDEHAIFGTSDRCIAVHASDFAVALTAFDAVFRIQGRGGARTIPAADFFLEPGATPERETSLEHGELIVGIDIPLNAAVKRSTYVKVRERQSYAFALASCAAGITLKADGTVDDVRIALGGVGTIPWRARAAENELRGQPIAQAGIFARAARAAFAGARPTRQNAYKIDLGISAIVRALDTVTA